MTLRRWRIPPTLALLTVFSLLTTGVVGSAPAVAAPPAGTAPTTAAAAAAPNPSAPGNEGGTPFLRDVLEQTGRAFVEARAAEAASRKRQAQRAAELKQVEADITTLTPQVAEVAANAYRTGRLGPVLTLLDSTSPDQFLDRARGLEMLAERDNAKLRALNTAREAATRAKRALDAEVTEQQKQTAIMAKQKLDAEKAMRLVGARNTGGFVSLKSPVAAPAPRNSDGSWPRQSCSIDDPTTDGCITPRTLHAMQEAKKAGFTRFVSCFRPGGPFEHPKGRACDFSPQKFNGFGGDATGEAKIYGNNLMAFFVRNADRLGVLYVIWYRMVWFPATGWQTYTEAHGDPSSDHTNHVHLSLL
jgi:hypothetical protein